MKITRARILQILAVLIVDAITLVVLELFLSGLQVNTFMSAIAAAIAYAISQAVFWFIFIQFLTWLPAILYPILTFVVSGFRDLCGNQFVAWRQHR